MPPRTRFVTAWTPPPFQPFPPGQRSRPAMGTGPAEAGAPGAIGNVFLTIDPLNGQALVGQRVTITGYRAGGNAPITISWSGPPGSSAPLTSTDRTISWIVQEGDSGTYTATATSPGAADSPQSAGITLTVGAAPPSTTIGMVTITGVIMPPIASDPDAAAYIAAVEAADGQALEAEVQAAMNELIIAVKATGFNMYTFFLLAGPRTLAGAMVMPGSLNTLSGTNLVSANYERKSGYLGANGDVGGIITSFHPTFLNGNVQQSTGLYLSEGGTTAGIGYERYQSAFADILFPSPGSGFDEMTVSTGGPVMRANLATPSGDNPGGPPAINWFTTPGAYYQRRLSSTVVQFGSPARGVIDGAQDHNPATTWTGPITNLPSGRMAALYQGNRINDAALGAAIAQYLEALDTAIP